MSASPSVRYFVHHPLDEARRARYAVLLAGKRPPLVLAYGDLGDAASPIASVYRVDPADLGRMAVAHFREIPKSPVAWLDPASEIGAANLARIAGTAHGATVELTPARRPRPAPERPEPVLAPADGRIGVLVIEAPREAQITTEYAAWWTDVELSPGEYEVRCSRGDYLGAAIPARITHERNASHLGGVAMGPDVQRRTGEMTTYHWNAYAHAVAKALAEGETSSIRLDPDIVARRVDYERRQSCEEALGFGYARDAAGAPIPLHEHSRRARDSRLPRDEREAARREEEACPQSGLISSHTYGLFRRA